MCPRLSDFVDLGDTVMRIRYGHIVLAACMGLGLPARAADGNGLQVRDVSWFQGRWASHIAWNPEVAQRLRRPNPYTMTPMASRHPLRGWTALRDYYFDEGESALLTPAAAGGLRATGGLVVTPRSTLVSTASHRSGLVSGSSGLTRQTLMGSGWDPRNDLVPVPYVGLGYTDPPGRSGWGFRADLGLMALHPQSAVKLGSALSGVQGVDELLGGMQLSPVLQIGVSYSF